MSRNPETGTNECDSCGIDVGNASVTRCAVVSDLDPDRPGMVRNLHFCRDRVEDDEEVRGCIHKLLNPATIRHYTERTEAAGD